MESPEGLRVKEFSPTFDKVAGADVQLGDYLTAVNGKPLKSIKIDDVIALIQATPPPRTLEFDRITELDGKLSRPPPNAIVYTVAVPNDTIGLLLSETPRGLTVRGFGYGFDLVVLKDVRVGDFLVAVNDQPVGHSLDQLKKLLKAHQPPRRLRFVRMDGVFKRDKPPPPPSKRKVGAGVAASPSPFKGPTSGQESGLSLASQLALADDKIDDSESGNDSEGADSVISEFDDPMRKKRHPELGEDKEAEDEDSMDGRSDADEASKRDQLAVNAY
jgi:PDZ domain